MADTSLYEISAKEIRRRNSIIRIPISRFSLPLILIFQGIISLIVLRNTAFQDEALYLYAGGQIINGWLGLPHFPIPWAYFLSGYAYFYPVIAGELNRLGGLELARMFSLLCMLTTTACVYYETKHLFDQNCAILAAALFAFQGPVLFLGRLATYDALCLVLIALAVVLALHVSTARRPWAILGIGPLLVLAILAKFAGLLFAPLPFAFLILCTLASQGWRKMIVRLVLALCSLAVAGYIAYITIDKEALAAISSTTTNRAVLAKTAALYLIQYIGTLSGLAFALGLLGLALCGRQRLLIGLLLFGSALLAPGYHIYKGELISLHKHLAFSMFFIMPLVGFAVARISGYRQNLSIGRHWMAGLAICLFTFSLGLQQAQNLYGEWAPSTNLTYAMSTQVRPSTGHYLAEDFDVNRYYLQNITALWQWDSLDFFGYTDKQHHYLVGQDAYRAAINDGYFDLVELSFGYNAPTAIFIDHELKVSKKYQLIDKIPLSNVYGTGYYWIWRKI